MADHDGDHENETSRDRKAEIRAKLEAREEAARLHRLEREAAAKVREAEARARDEAKAAARAQAKLEAEEKAEARARAFAEAKAAEQAKARERAEARALEKAAAEEEARARARLKPLPVTPADVNGRQRLIDAALRLHGQRGSFGALGIREIAREANLNPNTFYRHFESLDDLGVAAIGQIGDRLRPMLHQIHRLASRVDPATVAALEVSAFYAFALGNHDAFVVGVAEYHAGTPRVRESIAALVQGVADELTEDIATLNVFPMISRKNLAIVSKLIVLQLFHLSQDYVEKPEEREQIVEASESMIVWLYAGAALGLPTAARTP